MGIGPLVCINSLLITPVGNVLMTVTHSYSEKLVLRRIQYFITKTRCIGCAKTFNLTVLLLPIPVSSNGKTLGGSEQKQSAIHLQDLM